MSELQAAVEFQVELGKFYNVDLFQRGYYQLRTSLKMSPKVTAKVDVSILKEAECRLMLPGSVVNGVACSKTFQILYRKEDIDINDVIAFKVYMLVDMLKINENIADADFQLSIELWFTEEDFNPTQQEKLQCLSQRTLKLHFLATKGIHHYVPLLFDYFHLSAICLTVHGTLIALHQPYISLSRSQPRASLKLDQSLESALFGPSQAVTNSSRSNHISASSRRQLACQRHRRLCQILLSAYESIQTSFENLTTQLPNKIQVKIEHVDCRQKLEEVSQKCLAYTEEEDLFQAIQSDLATLCSQNVILWMQYLELVTHNEAITYQLAKEHHTLRVKRFSEGFFLNEYPKQEMIACYDPNIHGHVDLAGQIRSSVYYQSIPLLAVECPEVDGDSTTMPIIFEDIYSEPLLDSAIRFRSESGSKSSNRRSNRESCYSDISSASGESSSSITRKSNKLKFIKNVRPESLKRPSSYMNVEDQVAVDSTDCTLVGYRKLDQVNAVPALPVELGTLTTSFSSPPLSGSAVMHPLLYNAISLPTLVGHSPTAVNCSGSLPDLALNSPVMQMPSWSKFDKSNTDPSNSNSSSSAELELSVGPNNCAETTVTSLSCNGEGTLRVEGTWEFVSQTLTALPENSSLPEGTNENLDRKATQRILTRNKVKVSSLRQTKSSADTMCTDLVPDSVSLISEIRENEESRVAEMGQNDKKNKSMTLGNLVNHLLVLEPLSGDGPTNQEDIREVLDITQCEEVDASKDFERNAVLLLSQDEIVVQALPEKSTLSSQDVLECDADGVAGPYTVLELIKEEYERNQTEGGTSSSASSLSDLNSACKSKDQSSLKEMEEDGDVSRSDKDTKPCARNSPAAGSVPANSASEKPQRLVDEVTDKIVRFISAKEMLRSQLDLHEHFYSDFPSQISSFPYFTPPEKFFPLPDEGIHLVVCVHGLDGNSTDLRLVRTYLELALPSNKIEFLMSERNQVDTFADFEVMTDRLVQEILYHIELYGIKPSRISFIGHSLGNLIIRSAMSRPQMTELLPKLHTFLSLSGPHLGTLFNSSGLVNMGMWLMQKWKKSGSLLQLSLKDHQDPRQTFLYKLSQKTGLEFFRNILLVGSQQDRYVPFHSSRIELCKAALRDSSGWGAVYTEMVNNILQPIVYKTDINFIRYDVFHALSGTTNHLIGRAAHIAVLDSELFIEKFITVAALKYFI